MSEELTEEERETLVEAKAVAQQALSKSVRIERKVGSLKRDTDAIRERVRELERDLDE